MKRAFRWLPAVIWMAVIFYMSHQSGDDLHTLLPWFQTFFPWMESFNWGHFALYFILAATFYWALLPRSAAWSGKALAVALCVLYGLTDEYHQSFVPGREPDLLDIRNDGIGAALAMLLLAWPPLERFVRRVSG
ncbi:VanZ family protein [Paenibacillus hodogayensis]|uniref:VanZ family protein n=1 Tax=Paenibacillus hodogayensis TaxID=279208 RepID=A0ABV5VP28_9BACL